MDAKVNLWVKNETAGKEEWDLSTSDGGQAYVGHYSTSEGYNWQAWYESANRLSGSADSIDHAKMLAEQHLALPHAEFKALLVADVMRDFDDLCQRLRHIDPVYARDTLYEIGRRQGYADARAKVLEALS